MVPMATARGRTAQSFTTDEDRFTAIGRRDRRADGIFYFSVRTTGIYCRPSCPARRARRENVRFHATRAEAEAAGFRPCRRCRPDQPPTALPHTEAVARACRLMEAAEETPSLRALAQAVGVSRFHFHRMFKAVTGITPRAYAAAHRAQRVREELSRSSSVTEAIYGAGFNSSGRFYAKASEELGMTPTDFRAGGSGTSIRFATGACSLGSILVATTDKGVCAILLGADRRALVRELQQRFPRARLIGGDPGFERLVAQVVEFVETPARGLDLPLDVRGTAFQRRVWQALREIPAGATRTYTELARSLGLPRSVRAVARACATNAIAVAIPCHRVVRRDGALAGYRWGIKRKRALLGRERVSASP